MRASHSLAVAALLLASAVSGLLPFANPSEPAEALVIDSHDWVNQTISSSDDLVVAGSGHLVVHNSIYTITQSRPFEFSVTIEGTLELVNSTLTSNHPFNVTLASGGELVMRNSHLRPVGTLAAMDGTAILDLDNSDAQVNVTDTLTLKELSMRNSEMPLSPGLSADAITLSGVQYDSLQVSNCDDLAVASSEVGSLSCLLSYKTILLSESVFASVDLPNGKGLEISECDIGDLSLGVMKTVAIDGSTVGGEFSLANVNAFEAYDTRFEGDYLEYGRTIRLEKVDANELVLRGGGTLIDVSADYLNVTSTVQTTLSVYGWEHSTDNSNPANVNTDGIFVTANARVVLYRYLTATVTDYGGNGIEGAEVVVEDELTSDFVANGTTGVDGKARIAVKAVEIDSGGEEFVGSVQAHAEYDGVRTNDASLAMTEDRSVAFPMTSVNVPGGSEEGWWSWWYLVILLAVIAVVALAALGGWAYYNFIY